MKLNSVSKKLLIIFSLITFGVLIVVFIAWFTPNPTSEKSGFDRKISQTKLKVRGYVQKIPKIWSVAGNYGKYIFFQGISASEMYKADTGLNELKIEKLGIVSNENINSSFEIIVDSTKTLIFGKNIPITFQLSPEGHLLNTYKEPNFIITRVVPIGSGTFICRGFDTTVQKFDQTFVKYNIQTGNYLREKGISEINKDAGISTDGTLQYDSNTNSLIYLSYYRNKIISIDTNLKVNYFSSTIDTISTPRLMTGSSGNKGNEIYTISTPTKIVNNEGCVLNGRLYVLSGIKADNQTSDEYITNSVVDVYDLKRKGEYINSFYIPKFKEEKAQHFKVLENAVIVLYSHYIVSYFFDPHKI